MNKILRTLEQIKEISRKLGWNAEEVFMYGECGSLFHIMDALFHEEVSAYGLYLHGYNLQHILIFYNGCYYDINGEFTIAKFINNFNQNIGYNVLKESDYTIGTSRLQLNTECCGNYEKITGIPFNSSEEISRLFNQLKSLKVDTLD